MFFKFDLSQVPQFQLQSDHEEYTYNETNEGGNDELDVERFIYNEKAWRHQITETRSTEKKKQLILT